MRRVRSCYHLRVGNFASLKGYEWMEIPFVVYQILSFPSLHSLKNLFDTHPKRCRSCWLTLAVWGWMVGTPYQRNTQMCMLLLVPSFGQLRLHQELWHLREVAWAQKRWWFPSTSAFWPPLSWFIFESAGGHGWFSYLKNSSRLPSLHWHAMYSREKRVQSSFSDATWAFSLDWHFLPRVLSKGRLFFLIVSVIRLDLAISLSST